jgi:hypothetical protein
VLAQFGEGCVAGVVVAVEPEVGAGGGCLGGCLGGYLGEDRRGGEKWGEDEEAQRGRLR